MAGVGKLLKQAAKMQKQMEAAQEKLAAEVLEVSGAGGAVLVKINGQGSLQGLTVDPEFLKEEPAVIQDTLLAVLQEAQAKAKAHGDSAMEGLTGGLNIPGFG